MASEVMSNEEFRAHIKRMVTWMEVTESDWTIQTDKDGEVKQITLNKPRCPHCGQVMPCMGLPDETN